MPPASRFGASKFRNASAQIPDRNEWFRGSLPPVNTSTSPTSTFSSEIKTDWQWIVTLNTAGDYSVRKYKGEDDVTSGKGLGSGGGVGDWDLSTLNDGLLAIGGLDGSISIYQLPSSSASGPLQPIHGIPATGSAITNISFHPTTPKIILVSSLKFAAAIYDISSPSSTMLAIDLKAKEPKGMWTVGWSIDGKRVAGVGKSGTLYTWDPQSSTQPTNTRQLMIIQPLKPARLVWVGENIFLTTFSKTRNREYHLLKGNDLSTIFISSIDTNTAPLIPLVDQERNIVYVAGKGDMMIRQIELSGPQGYQETIHSLPHPIASTGSGLASPVVLDVMQAEIARLLVPVVDKDGDAILPLGIKVPRRQLIDFHEDLYPDISGFVPEQTAEEWLRGEDKQPLPISLDPSRRKKWESELGKSVEPPASNSPTTAPAKQPTSGSSPVAILSDPAKPSVADNQKSTPSITQPASTAPMTAPANDTSSEPHKSIETPAPPAGSKDLPKLQEGETYSSTTYKVRIIVEHIVKQTKQRDPSKGKAPLTVALQGPQGCGKTTLCDDLVKQLGEAGLNAAVLSLDDLYRTNAGLKEIAQQHPNNHLLSGRGPPGTHDVQLATSVLQAVSKINSATAPVQLPIFDKSLCGGEGDRSESTVETSPPIDVFVLEGWSMGFWPLTEDGLTTKYAAGKNALKDPYFTKHSLASLNDLNDYLQEISTTIYPFFECLIAIEPTDYQNVFKWRLEQEHAMKAKNGGKGMTDDQVRVFVERYMPAYELWREGMWSSGTPWAGKGLQLTYGPDREVLKVDVPSSSKAGSQPEPTGSTPKHFDPSNATPTPSPAAAKSVDAPPVSAETSKAPSTIAEKASNSPIPNASQTQPTPTSSTPRERFNPNWSRKFLAGKAPLIPSYDSIPPLSTLHPDSQILKVSSHIACFPIQGTGGRLAVHPLAKKGRMALGGEGYLSSGVEIADFDVELFEQGRVAVAGEDGVVRIWKVPKEGIKGVGPEPSQVLRAKGMEKIFQVGFHPTAVDVLMVASNDQGSANFRWWDLTKGEVVLTIPLPPMFNFAVSPYGEHKVAVVTKDGKLMVCGPGTKARSTPGKAHDSPRSFQIVWASPTSIISVGFSKGSQRRINLFEFEEDAEEVKLVASTSVDNSPSVLFPHYDPDTSILYIWGKGERVIHAYEVKPRENEVFQKLPSYTSGEAQLGVAWMPKRMVDVRKVEVAKVLRLTAKTMEEVSFTIPRNKPEFFQDDIYTETIDVENPAGSASTFLTGTPAPPKYISLKPEGMTPLSKAPKTTTHKTKFVPAKDVMSEEEKKRREMDALFAKAKMDESSDEGEVKTSGLDPPDDDW